MLLSNSQSQSQSNSVSINRLGYLIKSSMASAIIALSLNVNAAQSVEMSTQQQTAMGVASSKVEKVATFPVAKITGELMYALNKRHQISAPVAGKVVALYHMHGPVEKGELVAELMSEQWIAMQADLLQTQAALQNALQEFKRAKKLKASGVSSTKTYNQAQADVSKWQALKTQQSYRLKQLGMSSSQITKLLNQRAIDSQPLKLFAPVSGQLFNLKVSLNEEVSQGESLALLGEDDVLVIDVPVPVEMAMTLQEGDEVFMPTLQQSATISHIHNQVNSATQTIDIHIRIANPQKKLKAGLRLPVQFMQTPEQTALYKIPASAMSLLDGKPVVFQRNAEQIAALPVQLLSVSNGQAYVSLLEKQQVRLEQVVSAGSAAIKAAFSVEVNADEAE